MNLKQKFKKNAGKAGVVVALATAALAVTAPSALASAENHWTAGCRGYWYSTAGHGYCDDAWGGGRLYVATYDCNVEVDYQGGKAVPAHFTGKFSTHECTFKINGTRVTV
ncbi:hypothetical protein [Streptomyces xanthochromogenes]|uniref:hypothetical protein n=1 Tax=Streptomyces xanthochromogenes TaxID=67384 RepID=UPI00382B1F11